MATVAVVWAACAGSAAGPGSWPGYRCDNARSGACPEGLPTPLHLQWTYVPRHKPRPAWPEPCKEVHHLAFDYAPQVAIAHGLVFFGSSADHKVYAVELATGRERWSFFTGGPVRFAPAVWRDRVFAASDDGRLYCLSASDGKLLWRFKAGPRDERLMGNEQMISRWPARAGVLVEGNAVYFTAGMWQPDGVYVYSLRPQDGSVVWENNTSSHIYMGMPHSSMEGISGVSPQGYLALYKDTLIVPCGRAMPAGFDRNTGELLFCDNGSDKLHHAGGAWVMAAKDMIFGPRRPVHGHPHVTLQEAEPVPGEGMIAWDRRTGRQKLALAGKHRAVVSGNTMYATGDGEIIAVDMNALIEHGRTYYGTGKVDPDLPRRYVNPMMYWRGAGYPWGPWKVVPVSTNAARKWQSKVGRTYELILAGDTVIAGGRREVTAFSARDGQQTWTASIEGQARGLAVAEGRLIVSSTTGEIRCYAGGKPSRAATIEPANATTPDTKAAAAQAAQILKGMKSISGCCLILGVGDGRLAYELARQSDLLIHCIEPNADRVAGARKVLDEAGMYGVRVAVHEGRLDQLPYVDYFANLVVLDGQVAGGQGKCSARELYRVLRPCGGIACLTRSSASPSALEQWLADGGVPRNEIHTDGETVRVVRGQLPGAAEWTHEYCDASRPAASTDTRVRLPLKMLWFGKPGPAKIVSRHWRTPAPLFTKGRMFVSGEHHLMALDAYNGRQIWCREMRDVGRYPGKYRGGGIVADHRGVYAVVGSECFRLDAATGKTVQRYEAPRHMRQISVLDNPIRKALDVRGMKARPTPNEVVWEFLAVTERLIIGSVGQPNFAWTGWPEAHPECKYVFALGASDGKLRWSYTAKESVSPNAICIKGDRLYLIDQTSLAAIERGGRRGEKTQGAKALKALDLQTGKTLWETSTGLAGTLLWMGQDVLLVTRGETSAYSAEDGKLLWSQRIRGHPYPVIVGDTFYLYPGAYNLRTGQRKERVHPVTNKRTSWVMGYKGGCGSLSGCPGALFFRSGATGMYDLAHDSGTGWLGQVRASCWVNATAAGGMLLFPEGASSCSCPYNYQTSLAMVPDERHEDWSVFPAGGEPAGARVRRLALNFGAVGDKRDRQDTLWLAHPRPFKPGALGVPLFAMNLPTYYRRNADQLQIKGTDTPWLYTSGCKGLQRAELELFLNMPAPAPRCKTRPKIDGRLDDECWDGRAQLILTNDNQATDRTAVAYMRSDPDGLYIAFRREAAMKDGKPVAWTARTEGTDARAWDDDSFGVRLSDRGKRIGLYLHVSNTGATFDGRTDPGMFGLIGSDEGWNGAWDKAVQTEPGMWSAEIAMPWKTLHEEGMRENALSVYLESVNHTGVGPLRLQFKYRTLRRLYLFASLTPLAYGEPPQRPQRSYDVVLHFAELEDVKPGERVFDVKLQGETVIAGLDVVKEAGARNVALVKRIPGIQARDKLTLELVPHAAKPAIISAMEVHYDEAKALAMIEQSVNNGLVAHWTFDDPTGTTAKDDSGRGNQAEIVGPTRIAGKLGAALEFDGKDDYVNCGNRDSLNITDALTVSAWINIKSYHVDEYHDVVLSKGVGAYSIFLHRKGGGRISGYFKIGGELGSLTIHAPEFNEWHHIAMTVRDGQQKAYYDGVLQGSSAHSGSIGSTDRAMIIGYGEDFPARGHFRGMIDDVRIHNRALSPEEVQWQYGCGR